MKFDKPSVCPPVRIGLDIFLCNLPRVRKEVKAFVGKSMDGTFVQVFEMVFVLTGNPSSWVTVRWHPPPVSERKWRIFLDIYAGSNTIPAVPNTRKNVALIRKVTRTMEKILFLQR